MFGFRTQHSGRRKINVQKRDHMGVELVKTHRRGDSKNMYEMSDSSLQNKLQTQSSIDMHRAMSF